MSPLWWISSATLSGEPPASQLSCLRRLFWESHGLVVRDLRLRQEHGSDTVIKKLPTAEEQAVTYIRPELCAGDPAGQADEDFLPGLRWPA